jgi:predicted TIM-barrel fold metal-dependent hydrolase
MAAEDDGITIIDSHIHFFSHRFFEEYARWRGEGLPAQDPDALLRQLGWEVPPRDPVSLARRWVEELDRHGVAKAVLLASIVGDEDSVAQALRAFPDRLAGYVRVDPTQPDAAVHVRRAVRELGLKGVKLFPSMEGFHASDRRVYPVYEEAQALGVPILLHFGVLQSAVRNALGLPSRADMRFADPTDLQPAARDFPRLRFIIPHFGAGYFREALMVCYHCPNVSLDTSGSNAWTRYVGYPLDLRTVFRLALDAVGPGRIIFGTDSTHFPRGLRHDVLSTQLAVLRELEVPREDIRRIMAGNIADLLDL